MFNLFLVDAPKDLMIYNDVFFDRYYDKYHFGKNHEEIVRKLYNSELDKKYKRMKPWYNQDIWVSLTELSTGCKTALNIMCNKDKVFTLVECGDKAIDEILNLKEGNGYIDSIILPDNFTNTILVHYPGGSKECHNKDELMDVMFTVFK